MKFVESNPHGFGASLESTLREEPMETACAALARAFRISFTVSIW